MTRRRRRTDREIQRIPPGDTTAPVPRVDGPRQSPPASQASAKRVSIGLGIGALLARLPRRPK